MSLETLTALALFAFVSSITPGPNNLMLMASGANFGLRRTLPHMAGVGVGFVFLLVAVGAGLGVLLERWPRVGDGLRIACLAYLALLVWRIATAPPPGTVDPRNRPLTFLEAAAFQWVNPKGWAMALTTITAWVQGEGVVALLLAAAVFGVVNISSVSTWALAGTRIHVLLTNPTRARVFNLTMATLVVASVAPIVLL
ncbi:MAG TPA: LysE family translocator [Pseudomonadales bacterium]|nr:LysE family translocator [Pseudomonadales bacterium]